MKNCKKYLFLVFFIFSFDVYGQAIDPSILSQLSPEQIEMAKDAYAGKNSTDKSVEELPVIDESLVTNKSAKDANKISGQKYGYDFFSSTPTSLTAVGDLPLPNDYKISLRDQFTVILSGSKDAIFNLNVKLDGTILFPELGAISVVGLSLKDVKDKLSQLIEQSYIGVNIDISIQNLSAKKITIVGAVKTPGTYLINPFSTITGALAYSGGISEIGSLRDIKLIRNNEEIFSFDLYDLLIRGDRSKDLTIEAGDTLLINAASQFVEISGAVKRPAIYEILEGETIKDIVDFALGFDQTANKSNISVSFLDLNEAAIVKKNISSNYDPRLSSAELFREYEAYGETVAGLTKHRFVHDDRPPVEGRRIRVGYSSPDFRGHVCRFFMEPIFRNHDRDQFELFAYSNTVNPDDHTERMKGYFDHWVDVVRMSDEEMAQRVYDDQIDILVDMAGHTAGNRLPVFGMRPAPIQASSSIGFGYTTGLKEVDYFICDENLVPAGSEAYFSEEPLRLPAPCLAYAPPRDVIPDLSELPALSKGHVTFGSLTRLTRLNDPQLRIWGEILERVPGSRLRLDQKPFAHEGTREMFWERLKGLGIARDRVDLTCSSPHWDAYREIDITLDCWPHNAGTTTIESLWMGVPVLSKLDRVSVGRVGAMILEPLGLGDWLVESEEDYIERAVAAASDLGSLAVLRGELRSRLEGSALLDEVAFAQNLEHALLKVVAQKGSPR
jgi:protein involved in polysaccharide export with SLBB domain